MTIMSPTIGNNNEEGLPSSWRSHITSLEELKNKLDGCQAYYERMQKARYVLPIARVEPIQRHDVKPMFLKPGKPYTVNTTSTAETS